jgi:purine-binding chemotaxis protein CheW
MKKKDQMVTFRVGKELFGVPIHEVQEIVRVPEVTMVPEMPSFVEGVINLRGRIVSIIDVNKRLRLGGGARTKASRILIVDVDKKVVGLLVDAVTEILRLPPDSIEPAPEIVTSVGSEYIMGVGKLPGKLIILLELQKILKPEEIKRLAADEQIASPKDNMGRTPMESAA